MPARPYVVRCPSRLRIALGWVAIPMLSGWLFALWVYLGSDDVPGAVVILVAAAWSFVLAFPMTSELREARPWGRVILVMGRDGVYLGDHERNVPWHRISRVTLFATDLPPEPDHGRRADVTIHVEGDDPPAHTYEDVSHGRVKAAVARFAPGVPVVDGR